MERHAIPLAELNQHIADVVATAPEACNGVRLHAIRLENPDANGCNWAFQAMRSSEAGYDCMNELHDALNNLKGYWNVLPE